MTAMADRYLVVLARTDASDFYLLTPDEWQAFQGLQNEGLDTCMAVSRVTEGDEDRDYFISLQAVFDYTTKHDLRLAGGDMGIGY